MADPIIKDYFPKQNVNDEYKHSAEYGLKVGRAIEAEWFENGGMNSKFQKGRDNYHKLRSYARGEQSVQKYKDELSINGDLSYLNLDWKPVPIIPKFVDIVVNGIAERTYDIKAYSQDPYGVEQRTKYMESILKDMRTEAIADFAEQQLGINIRENKVEELPGSEEELMLNMQLTYKQSVELAEEQALNVLFEGNNYELIKKRFYYDLTVIGIGAVKTCFNTSEGVTIDYVDPADLVYSYTESPYFNDIYYAGEVKMVYINEVVKQFPNLTQEEIEDIVKNKNHKQTNYNKTGSNLNEEDSKRVQDIYFNYKTYMNEGKK